MYTHIPYTNYSPHIGYRTPTSRSYMKLEGMGIGRGGDGIGNAFLCYLYHFR